MSGIDLNRAGTPLLEIVSEPELRGAKEAVAYARALHSLVMWIGICDGNMQEGSFRCDANVSVRKTGDQKLGTRCEIKNLNSFRFMERAIEFEARRQIELLEDGQIVVQETRLYDPERDETRSMRTKEDAQDYRYLPDPDLLPLVVTEKMIEKVRADLPELPDSKRQSFVSRFSIPAQTAAGLTSSRSEAQFFEDLVASITTKLPPSDPKYKEVIRSTANSVVGEVTAALGDSGRDFSNNPISVWDWATARLRIADGTISGKIAKDDILPALLSGEGSTDEIIEKRGLKQISDSGEIERLVDEVLAANARQVQDYRAGKEKAFHSLVGQVMKATRGKANPAQVNELLKRKLS
jgi:aspartyl-tRNA(Asn)/glutamyl-tRNA(Gln) amidotransferase subunit B